VWLRVRTAILWAVAKRGMLDEAMEIYRAMKNGEEVDVATSCRRMRTAPAKSPRYAHAWIREVTTRSSGGGGVTPIFRAFARYGSSSRRANSTRELFAASSLDRTRVRVGVACCCSSGAMRATRTTTARRERREGERIPHRIARGTAVPRDPDGPLRARPLLDPLCVRPTLGWGFAYVTAAPRASSDARQESRDALPPASRLACPLASPSMDPLCVRPTLGWGFAYGA
jgi:hypothetical protein